MNQETYQSADKLPSELRKALGTLLWAIPECPGVHYIGVEPDEKEASSDADEYYLVEKSTPMISNEVKAYGNAVPGCPDYLLYPYLEYGSGYLLVGYEVCKYRIQNHIPLPPNETLHEIAVYAAEEHPEYFGRYPVPSVTPWGCTLRHKAIDNGAYWIETDQYKEILAVNYTMRDDFSSFSKLLSRQIGYFFGK